MKRKSPSPELTTQQNETTPLAMNTIPEAGGEASGEAESTKVKEETVNMNGEVGKERGLKRYISK